MAKTEAQERLTAARKRARDQLAKERQSVEDQAVRYHRALVTIEELTAQLHDAEAERETALQELLGSGRTPDQVAALLGVEVDQLGPSTATTNGKRRLARAAAS